ncbi:MAG TPA: CDP-alcohol phosphatidyltransferase family protein [Chloroflexi bacterium]|nr:MAG: CDP-alcohol phosphatidyltransferase family protein [Chloroflexota bacterium]HDN05062.1 CDP-alcohol phosphatidyltransferase family protein [Chloroflexota bacterium]
MANLITIARFPLLFLYLAVLYYGNQNLLYWNVPFIILIFLLDSLDGWVARKKGESSLLGSVLDIATDRTLEYVLWVIYAHLGLIPVIVPIIVLIRGTTVDAVRAVGMKSGKSAFEQIQSPLNRFLVGSRFMRALYGFSKAAAAGLFTLVYALPESGGWFDLIYQTGVFFTWLSVFLCLIRGIPVLAEGVKSLS